jgi:flavin-dependent dehydrogenase
LNSSAPASPDFDVVIVGGALAGAASAILLRRQDPNIRVLILEKSAAFGRRVGEATVEVSAYFLGRILGLTSYLNEAHLIKQGMRFWFFNERTAKLDDCSEIGGRYMARVPSYQLDRSTVDEEVLRRAVASGAELLRPASAQQITLQSGGLQTVTVRVGEGVRTITARWVIDASGVGALLSRQEGWFRQNTEHPTTAVWSRWRNVKDWDGYELATKYPVWARECHGVRGTATNHLVGHGWWAWVIPLKGGDVSIGVVFDQRLVKWPEGGSLGARLKEFLSQHPVGRELLVDAEWVEGDVHWRKNLPYFSTTYATDGAVLVGDSGAFIDPFYSPGMDWISFTAIAAAELIAAQRRGEAVAPLVEQHNRTFVRSYARWFRAVYKDKYEYMGDYQLMRLGFLLDLGLYYLGVAAQPFKRGYEGFLEPVFTTAPSVPFYKLMSFYGRRLAAIARARRRRGCWGRCNAQQRFMFGGYTFARSSSVHVIKALIGWFVLELREGWRSWFVRAEQPAVEPARMTTAEPEPLKG